MMDFDDLDEEFDARVASGEKLSSAATLAARGAVRRPGAYEPWGFMPRMPRSFRLPGRDSLPPGLAASLPEEPRRDIGLRVFVFCGAGDMAAAWAATAASAPRSLELAVHEWPSHGAREDEPAAGTLDELVEDAMRAVRPVLEQHMRGRPLEGAPFALLGHSIGCLLATALAARLRMEMGLEPAVAIMLDRGPPHMPQFNEVGRRLRESDPDGFFRDFNPVIWRTAQSAGGERRERITKMWVDDIKHNDDTREVGFHTLECDLVVLRAALNSRAEDDMRNGNPEVVESLRARAAITASPPETSLDFAPEQFTGWETWTSGICKIVDVEADHMTVKTHPDALRLIWETLESVKAKDPPCGSS